MSRDSTWLRHDPATGRVVLTLHIQPGARKSEIAGLHGGALKVRIAAPAVDNKANTALVEFLGDVLGVPKSLITIRRGAAGRSKVVEIAGGPDVAAKLQAFVGG